MCFSQREIYQETLETRLNKDHLLPLDDLCWASLTKERTELKVLIFHNFEWFVFNSVTSS